MFSYKACQNFKNSYFEEYLRTTAPEYPQKISLAWGKPILDAKWRNWAANTLSWKYEPRKVNLRNIHVIPKCLFYILQTS